MLYNIVTLLLLKGRNMQRNEIIEAINQKTFEAKKLINEINDLKKLLLLLMLMAELLLLE